MKEQELQHYHYVVQGYNKFDNDLEKLFDAVEINVYTTNEQDALDSAKKIVKKKFYRIAKAWECFEDHGLSQEIQMAQLEVQTKMLKMHS